VREAAVCANRSYLAYTHEVAAHFRDCIAVVDTPFEAPTPRACVRSTAGATAISAWRTTGFCATRFLLECDTFLTIQRRLARNAVHLSRVLEIELLRPPELLAYLRPHLAGV
jgi:hypothetical protein